jgi:hypothetical protein
MIRRFNFTGRRKIPRSRLNIFLYATPDASLAFDAGLDMENLSFPFDAKLYIEAYRRTYLRRFSCGTVAQPRLPRGQALDGLDSRALVMFRVKVVDGKGRILAVADRVMPRRSEDEDASKQCLLPVEFADLGHLIWRLDLDGEWPSLLLNNQIDNIREIARADESFQALVYPEVVRQILHHIVIGEDHTDPDTDPDDWMSLWLRFTISLMGRKTLPPSGGEEHIVLDKGRWIDDAVDAFCASQHFVERFIQNHQAAD